MFLTSVGDGMFLTIFSHLAQYCSQPTVCEQWMDLVITFISPITVKMRRIGLSQLAMLYCADQFVFIGIGAYKG